MGKIKICLMAYHTFRELEKEMKDLFKRFNSDYMLYIAEYNGNIIGFIEVSIHESAVILWDAKSKILRINIPERGCSVAMRILKMRCVRIYGINMDLYYRNY